MTLQNKIYQQRINGINLGEQIGYVVKDPEWQPNTPTPSIPLRRIPTFAPTEYEEDDPRLTPEDIWPEEKYTPPPLEFPKREQEKEKTKPKPKPKDWRDRWYNPFWYGPPTLDPLPTPTRDPWFPTPQG